MTTFVKAAARLIDCVEFDMNGAGGKGGNGGLLSDTTLRAAHDLRVIVCRELAQQDYFAGLVARAREAATKASAKFPQPNYVTLKIAEEAGEVVRGAVHYAEGRLDWTELEGEIVQLIAMLIRFVTEGDQINGIMPPASVFAQGGAA